MRGGSLHHLRTAVGPELLEPVHDLLTRLWADEPEVPEADRIRFETAVAEVAANIAEHGAASGAERMSLRLSSRDDCVEAVFEDDGGPAVVPSDVAMPGEEAERGWGLPLVRAGLDAFDYRRDGGTNRWVLTLRPCPPAPSRGSPRACER